MKLRTQIAFQQAHFFNLFLRLFFSHDVILKIQISFQLKRHVQNIYLSQNKYEYIFLRSFYCDKIFKTEVKTIIYKPVCPTSSSQIKIITRNKYFHYVKIVDYQKYHNLLYYLMTWKRLQQEKKQKAKKKKRKYNHI